MKEKDSLTPYVECSRLSHLVAKDLTSFLCGRRTFSPHELTELEAELEYVVFRALLREKTRGQEKGGHEDEE